MRIIITRHGETEENISGILQGHLPGKLSKDGIKQAKLLAKRLENEKFDYIFSSDLARAKDTTEEIISKHQNQKVTYKEILRERHFGDLQGKNHNDLGITFSAFREGINNNKTCETLEQVFYRGKEFLKEIKDLENNATILVVCHSGIGRGIIGAILGEEDLNKIGKLKNTSISIFEINNGNVEVICQNCAKHLD